MRRKMEVMREHHSRDDVTVKVGRNGHVEDPEMHGVSLESKTIKPRSEKPTRVHGTA